MIHHDDIIRMACEACAKLCDQHADEQEEWMRSAGADKEQFATAYGRQDTAEELAAAFRALDAGSIRRAIEEEVWRAMAYAPTDGTEIVLLIRHRSWWSAKKCGEDLSRWEGPCRGRWLDFNGGGWTWEGFMGTPIGWRPTNTEEQA